MNRYKHIKTGNVYRVENMNVINCNDDIQEIDNERIEVLYSKDGKFFIQEKNEFLKKFRPLKTSCKKKAIIVSYADITEKEKELLNSTNIFKVGLNLYDYPVDVDCRVWSELFVPDGFNPKEPVVLIQAVSNHKKAVRPKDNITSLGSSLLDAIQWLKSKGYTDILLIATNEVHADHFQEKIKRYTKEFSNTVDLWQYRYSNFKLPRKTIKEFINEERSGLCVL